MSDLRDRDDSRRHGVGESGATGEKFCGTVESGREAMILAALLSLIAHVASAQPVRPVIQFNMQFIRLHTQDDTASRASSIWMAPLNDEQQRLLLNTVNRIWSQCFIHFNLVPAQDIHITSLRQLIPTHSELIAEDFRRDARARSIEERFGASVNLRPDQLPTRLPLARKMARLFTTESLSQMSRRKLVRVVSAPLLFRNTIFNDHVIGTMFGEYTDELLIDFSHRGLSDLMPTNYRNAYSETYFIGYDHEFSIASAFHSPTRQEPSTLAHELGHFLGLSHTSSIRQVMFETYGDGNALTPTQCADAREFAIRTKTL